MILTLLKTNIMLDGNNIDLFREFHKQLVDWNNYLTKVFQPLIDYIPVLQDSINKAPESLRILAHNGWYISMEFDFFDINCLADLIKQGDFDQVDKMLINYFDNESSVQQAKLLENFPERKEVLSQAFKAHNNQDYYLSVPIFYSQVEGICKKLTGHRFFSTRHQKPYTQNWANNFKEGSLMGLLLEPLKHIDPNRQIQIHGNPLSINRHDILHGDSLEYGNDPINSYKAFSLLWFIGETVLESTKGK